MAGLFKVKALYDFEAKEEDDLGFPGGQIIDVTEVVDDNWLEGKYTDAEGAVQAGIFPREFVEKYEPPLPARPTRPTRKQDAPAPQPPPAAINQRDDEDEDDEEADAPATVAVPVALPTRNKEDGGSSAQNTTIPPAREPVVNAAPAPTQRAVPEGPVAGSATAKKPPPVAVKSNAFKDRIAAFNQAAAQPVVPIMPGKPRANDFIKKQFVAPPPSASAYVPPPKVEPIVRPYHREEDPEIIRKQEEDHAAAEAAGLTSDGQGEGEEAPKPTSLKERIALLQQQQLEQAQRLSSKPAKKPPVKKASESSEYDQTNEDDEDQASLSRSREPTKRQSLDVARDRPRIPSTQRRPADNIASLPVPEHDIVSDGNEADQSAAGETTEDDADTIGPQDDDDDGREVPPVPISALRAPGAPKHEADVGEEEGAVEDGEDGDQEEEEEIDEETRRKMELRERMAKMSGGFGMPGMINPLAGLPKRAPPAKKTSTKSGEEAPLSSPPLPQQHPRIPVMPIPVDLPNVASPQHEEPEDDDDEEEEEQALAPIRRSMTEDRAGAPPVPRDSRPPPVPQRDLGSPPAVPVPSARPQTEARPVPPPPQAVTSPGPGSESDDEASNYANSGADTLGDLPPRVPASRAAPPVPNAQAPLRTPTASDQNEAASYLENNSETTTSVSEKRASRVPPPIPSAALARPPPPPPPGTLSRRTTELALADDQGRGESDYEGDYDTDIASGANHKEALKAHLRESSIDDGSTLADEPLSSPVMAPRAVPPPPPPHDARKSVDISRAPPPVPPSRGDDYDPYRAEELRSPPPIPVAAPAAPPPPPRAYEVEESSADDEELPTTRPSMDTRPPPPPPQAAPLQRQPSVSAQPAGRSRQSLDASRTLAAGSLAPESAVSPGARASLDVSRSPTVRRSGEQSRSSFDGSSIAAEIPLNEETPWWTASQPLPPVLQPRRNLDILTEMEESTATKRGGQSVVTKNIYILFSDYSETSISAKYDPRSPLECELQQNHKPAPARPRQDQLESYWQRFGRAIADKANSLSSSSKKDSAPIGDGTPTGLISELIKDHPDALQPVGVKSYGALVYANLGNATTQQFDEIRPGDIVTLRSAKFEGHHGAMKTKYRQEYGVSHVAVVEEWDGTRKAVRVWEQGRDGGEGKKDRKSVGVKSDKLRLADLRSGEVLVWRVVGRDFVGW